MPFQPTGQVIQKKDLHQMLVQRSQESAKKAQEAADEAAQHATLLDTLTRGAKKVTGVLGLNKTTDTFGSLGARAVSQDARQYVPKPTGGEIAGAVGNTALALYPGATIEKGAANIAGRAIASKVGQKLAGQAAKDVGFGYAADISHNLESGKTGGEVFTPGVGTLVGAAIPAGSAAKAGAKKIASGAAPKLINSLIKPVAKELSYGKNPGRAVAEEGITGNTYDELAKNIATRRDQIGHQIGQLGQQLGKSLSLKVSSALSPIDTAIKEAASTNNQNIITRLEKVKQVLTDKLTSKADATGATSIVSNGKRDLNNLSFSDALDLKRLVGKMTAFTGNPSDDKIVNQALKRVYGSIKGSMEDGVRAAHGDAAAANVKKLNEKYADLMSAEIATKNRSQIAERANMLGFGDTVAGASTAIATLATGGGALPAVLMGATGVAIKKALASPRVKTKVAKWLASGAPKAEEIFKQAPQLKEALKSTGFRLPGDFLLDSKAGQFLKDEIKKAHPSAGLSVKDVNLMKIDELKRSAGYIQDRMRALRDKGMKETHPTYKGSSKALKQLTDLMQRLRMK